VDFTSFAKLSDFPSPTGLTVYGQIGKYANAFLTALEDSKKFHVLQRPSISILNHKKGVISTGQQIAIPGQTYTTGTAGTTTAGIYSTTTYVPVELRLEVIPHIYANNEVKLEFSQSNSDVSGFTTISGNQVPNLTHQSLENTIIVPNESTIMLGGLITERDTKNTTGLPFLIHIPLIKYLFGNVTKNKERDELLIFLRPRIVSTGSELVEEQTTLERNDLTYKRDRAFLDEGSMREPPAVLNNNPDLYKAQTAPQNTSGKQVDLSGRFNGK
jgi:type II secretory pathway component GspD/PulD (secretin)